MSLVAPHLRRHRWRLLVTYGVVALENVFELLYPFAIGMAVDDLLDGSTRGLWVFAGVWALHTVIGVARQRFDTRVFAQLYTELATDVLKDNRRREVDASTTVARSALALEFVDFFERDVHTTITAAFGFVGSLIMITILDPVLGAASAALALPFAVVNIWMFKRSSRAIRTLNDEFEMEAAVLAEGTEAEVEEHYRALGRDRVRLSDAEATSWGTLEFFVIMLGMFAFVRATDLTDQPGVIYATIAYVWSYVESFDQLPTVVQRLTNLRDIVRRLDDTTP